jgi:hypothetical protein
MPFLWLQTEKQVAHMYVWIIKNIIYATQKNLLEFTFTIVSVQVLVKCGFLHFGEIINPDSYPVM